MIYSKTDSTFEGAFHAVIGYILPKAREHGTKGPSAQRWEHVGAGQVAGVSKGHRRERRVYLSARPSPVSGIFPRGHGDGLVLSSETEGMGALRDSVSRACPSGDWGPLLLALHFICPPGCG